MTKRICAVVMSVAVVAALLAGCGDSGILDPKNPVTLALWHPYGQQMQAGMAELVEIFNNTIGAKEGIAVRIAFIGDATDTNEKLTAAANGDPGSPELPDIAVIYPRIGIELAQKNLLMDMAAQFSEEELSRYVASFIEEGKLGGDTLYILPIAKSTEVLYVNASVFDRLAKDTGVTYQQLSTFEGLFDAAEKYHEWSGGKTFFRSEDVFNMALLGLSQLGEDFIIGDTLNFASPSFEYVWTSYYSSAVKGGTTLLDGYGNYLMASGEAVCVISSSASVTFYPDTVTYADNTKEDCNLAILPYPVYEGGEKIALQRGGGLCVFKSTPEKEYAAGIFLKWLTEPSQNISFTLQSGYMPVTEEAFDGFADKVSEITDDENLNKLYATIADMQRDCTFLVPPVFDGLEQMQRSYRAAMSEAAENSRREYLELLDALGPKDAYEAAAAGAFEAFRSEMGY